MISLLQLWDGIVKHHEKDAAFKTRISGSAFFLYEVG